MENQKEEWRHVVRVERIVQLSYREMTRKPLQSWLLMTWKSLAQVQPSLARLLSIVVGMFTAATITIGLTKVFGVELDSFHQLILRHKHLF